MWPSVSPSKGKRQVLDKLEAIPDHVPGALGRSFRHDVLGPWGRLDEDVDPSSFASEALAVVPPPPPPAAEPRPTRSLRRRRQGKQQPQGGTRAATALQAETHNWRWRSRQWVCVSCLARTRQATPNRAARCPGHAEAIQELLRERRGHKLMTSYFSNKVGIIITCARCGSHTSSRRRNKKLHQEPCLDKPLSPGAAACLERVRTQWHPKHAEGEAKVLEPWLPLDSLLA